MSAQSIIHYYNRLNGNAISLPKLKEFRERLQNHIDADGHGPHMADIKGIYERAGKLIKMMNAEGINLIERINIKPIELKPVTKTKSPIAERIRKAEKVKAYGDRVMKEHYEGILYGLETENPDGPEKGLGFTQGGQQKIYDMVTKMILDTMKQDKLFWREPWGGGGKKGKKVKVNIMGPLPVNFATKAPYSGINYWLLKYVAPKRNGYTVLNYVTIGQVNQLGGKIKKGAKAWPVIYYSLMYKYNGNNITEDQFEMLSEDEQKKAQKIPFIQFYRVFNAHDVEGVPGIMEQVQARKTVLKYEVEPIKAAEAIVEGMPKRPYIQQSKQRRAYYSPGGDFVHMPYIGVFDKEQEYYSTYFHELVHSTGHESRLDRVLSMDKKKYAFEELIAELGASYLCAESGILYFTLKNSAAYLKGWSKSLREEMEADNKFFLKAAAKSQQAADFIADRKKETKATKVKAGKSVKMRQPTQHKQVAGLSAQQSAVKAAIKPTVVSKQPEQLSGTPKQNLSGVTHQYYAHDLGPFTNELVKMNSDAVAMYWGMPGHGKTGKMLLLAQHFANQGKKVLYVADEEYGKSTLEEKFKDLNLEPKFKISGTLTDKDLKENEIFFFDSVNTMGLNPKSVKEMVRNNPGKTYNLILQTTKEGDFRGGNDWEHLVDVAGEIKNRKITLVKNRFDKDNATRYAKKQMDDAITEATKKAELRKAVKLKTESKPEPQPQAA